MKNYNDSFLQPIVSIFGLAVSVIGTLSPVLSKNIATTLFISSDLIAPSSFIAFVIGIAVIWQIISFQPYIQWNLGKLKERGRGFNEYKFSLGPNRIFWVFVLTDIAFASFFILIKIHSNNLSGLGFFEFAQFILYVLFFLFLTLIFSILFAQTRQRFQIQEKQDNFPFTVFETLEKNRLVKPGIEIYENTIMDFNDLISEGIKTFTGMGRKLLVKTTQQEEEVIEFIVSENGRELLRVLKKEKKK